MAAAVRPWETLSEPAHVSWFVPGARTSVVAEPAAGSRVAPLAPLTLTFARPVASVLGSRLPRLEPAMPGHWQQVDSHTLTFRPTGLGFGLGGIVRVRVPGRVARLEGGGRLDAAAAGAPRPARLSPGPLADDRRLAFDARRRGGRGSSRRRAGRFSWRYPGTPASLRTLWRPGSWNVVTQGAVMRFENVHGMATDGVAGPQVWRALMHDDLAGRRSDAGYNYVFVHESIPQSLSLWHNGRVILTSPGNTGIAQAPTAQGTWPVFEHIPVGTMSGTNPDGSHYHDPGIRWISYFHGGDALHAFPRASFGTPQSLGCVELPEAAAARDLALHADRDARNDRVLSSPSLCPHHLAVGKTPLAGPTRRPEPRQEYCGRAKLGSPADVAQLVEHITRNDGVRGSSPRVGFFSTWCSSWPGSP